MKATKITLMAAAALALSACVQLPTLPTLPGAQPVASSGVMGPPGGYQQPWTAVPTAPDACNSQAFMEGYKAEYYLTWNRLIGPKQGMFEMQAKQRPTDPVVAWNASLYKGKLFNLQGYDNGQSRYGMHNITSTDYLKRCAATSYQKGQNAGGAAALQGFRELEAKERR